MELRYTEEIFSKKDGCSAGDLICLRYVVVCVLARVVIARVDLYYCSTCKLLHRAGK